MGEALDLNGDFGRLDELLMARALGDLEREEAIELDALFSLHPEFDSDEFDLAAASIDVALDGSETIMPDRVRQKIESDSRIFFGVTEGVFPAHRVVRTAGRTPKPATAAPRAWQLLATAAVVALLFWVGDSINHAGSVVPVELREQLLSAGDFVQWNWTGTGDATVQAENVSGDVVWSAGRQEGTMTIRGLVANDPSEFQYQLWIFDRERDERYPVDGGVFDIPNDGAEIVIPIAAKLRVDEPYLFAITVETPGGVVVSSRERIAFLAQPPTDG